MTTPEWEIGICLRIATWLDDQVQQAQIREAAHAAGFKVGDVRRVLASTAQRSGDGK